MNTQKQYDKVIGILRRNIPELTGRGELTDRIMRQIKQEPEELSFQKRMTYTFFGWTSRYWVKVSMTAAAIFFLGFFIVQQFMIANRLNRLEEQLVGQVYQVEFSNRFQGIIMNNQKDDSITVSINDLEALLNDYSEMINRLKSAQPAYFDMEYRLRFLQRKHNDKSDSGNVTI